MSDSHHPLAEQVPGLDDLLAQANHMDVKTVSGPAALTLREFIARALSYQPGWMILLYRVRNMFARLLRLPADPIPDSQKYTADDVTLIPGESFLFLQLEAAEDNVYWRSIFEEKHLTGWLIFVASEPQGAARQFHMMTIVRYNSWAGPVYFNVIRPFHHLIVHLCATKAVKSPVGQPVAK
ncbi:MAG: DUF2867 domain-containing protein [Anaerolineae bacterium]|nr:DUF2867 domain-containing protein [Anaerolineae bacterium]